MPTGKVRWFNHKIGAGFIRSDEGENIFFRVAAVHGKDPQTIREGQPVRFDIARNVRSLSQTAACVTTADFLS
jgi:cold shock CspA family protein